MDETNDMTQTPQSDDFLIGWDDVPEEDAPEEAGADEAPETTGETEPESVPLEETAPPMPPDDLRMRSDILEFARSFPEAAANPAAIPPEIWAEVGRGRSLTAAYAQWAVRQERARTTAAQNRSATLERFRHNASRSTGSMRTAGGGSRRKDPFLEGWDD